MSGGAIAGATVGAVFGIGALAGLGFFLIRRRRQKQGILNSSFGDDTLQQANEKEANPHYEIMTKSEGVELPEQLDAKELEEKPAIELPAVVPANKTSTINLEHKAESLKDAVLSDKKGADEKVGHLSDKEGDESLEELSN
jgi:LPXTG-motif cell wall-anchored protein